MIWWLSDEWMSLSIHVTVMFCMQFFTCTRNSQSYYYHLIPGYLSYVTNQNEVNQHCVEFLQFPVHVPTSVCLLQAACVYVQPASSQYTAKHASVQWIPHVNHTSSISSETSASTGLQTTWSTKWHSIWIRNHADDKCCRACDQQEAQLSQRDREIFVSLNISLSHSKSLEMTLMRTA